MITLVYCVDKKFLTQQLVSLISLTKYTKEQIKVINLTVEIPEFNAKGKKFTDKEDALCESVLKKANAESTYKSIDVSEIFKEHLLRGPNTHNKYYSYYITVRLLMHLVPEIPDKAIYLDADTIFNDDVKKLWDIDVSDVEVAGRRDVLRISKYVQSGVMLLNLKMIRQSGAFANACKLCTTKKYIAYVDMSALNQSCKKKKIISKKFNSFTYSKDCVIHHVCATRESKLPFTKKWHHRIKTDEVDYMTKIFPQYAYIYDELANIKLENAEMF